MTRLAPKYRSSIPSTARERVVERYPSNAKQKAEYVLHREVVGVRFFHKNGEPAFEYALKNGHYHGRVYRWDKPGVLLSMEPYRKGQPHGLACQWAANGNLLGTYQMEHGTGIDLWWQKQDDETIYLAEVRPMKDGQPYGFEWWLNEDSTLSWERHWINGLPHGIERSWNRHGRLRRGYPRYYLQGERVSKRRYIRACGGDSNLPKFRAIDQRPKRVFSKELLADIRRSTKHRPQRKSK